MWLKIYNTGWFFLSAFLIPATFRKQRFRKRWAIQLPENSLNKGIWIHALSVGEVLSAIPLIDAISCLYNKDIGFTVTTKKGMRIAESNLKNKLKMLYFFPFDFFWSVKRFVKKIDPSCFILIETDIWPFLLNFLHSKGIKCFLVNGRISPATYHNYSRFPYLVKNMFNCFELCMMQSEEDKEKLINLGISRDKVISIGNIKFDREIEPMSEEEKKRWKELIKVKENEIIWIAGSTHPGEEAVILDVFKRLKEKFPLVLIIAPRNIERANEIYSMGKEIGFNVAIRSKLPASEKPDLILIDTIGELARLYSIADIAFVGGSLVPFGGHNLIEPASFGIPVMFGPYIFNFKDISDALIKAGAGIMTENKETLYCSTLKLIENAYLRAKMSESCKDFISKNRGATKRAVSLIKEKLQFFS